MTRYIREKKIGITLIISSRKRFDKDMMLLKPLERLEA